MAASHYAYNTLKMPGPMTIISVPLPADKKDVPESSTGKSKESRAEPPQTKKVSIKEDGTGGAFTIGSTLDDK